MKGVSPIRVDFISDTITRPTTDMRAAMAAAEVGDDVYGEDPTVNLLEERVAELLGKEAALFMPSGTMSNLIGLMVHCQPGDEFICEAGCHIFNYEQAGYAQIGGIAVQPLTGINGVLSLEQIQDSVRPENDHLARTRLVCLENSHNRASGRILPYDGLKSICDWAASQGLARHLDGARLFNAVVASGIAANQWAQHFDTVSVCFSKGLGTPVGSALAGPQDAIVQARRYRKLLGGGMRQAGILAAAAIYALDNHIDRLAEDHIKAQILLEAIRQTEGLSVALDPVETNIVIFQVDRQLGTANDICNYLMDNDVRMLPVGPQKIRAVTHLDVSLDDCEEVAELICEVHEEV